MKNLIPGKSMRAVFGALAVMAALASTPAIAQISYSEDFEGLTQNDPDALANTGWQVFGIVWSDYPGCTAYVYDYGGVFPAPNGGGAFSEVLAAENGATGQAINVFNDYNNGDHGNATNRCIESSVFQQTTVESGDEGDYEFRFTTQVPVDLGPNATVFGFIKLLDPNNGFSLDLFLPVDTSTGGLKVIPFTLDGTAVGKILQWGYTSQAGNFEATGRYYDNLYVGAPIVTPPPVTPPPDGGPIYGTSGNSVPIPTLDKLGLLLMLLTIGGLGAYFSRR